MSNESANSNDNDLGRGGLTAADREYLRKSESERKEDYSRQSRSEARSRIRRRARASLRDFRVLAEHLDAEEREKIFSVEQGTQEHLDLETDLTGLLAFVYAGLGSEGAFRRVLTSGIRRGIDDPSLYTDSPMWVNVRFEVEPAPTFDFEAVAENIKQNDIRKIPDRAALGFLMAAQASSNAFDDELIDTIVEDSREMVERVQNRGQRE